MRHRHSVRRLISAQNCAELSQLIPPMMAMVFIDVQYADLGPYALNIHSDSFYFIAG